MRTYQKIFHTLDEKIIFIKNTTLNGATWTKRKCFIYISFPLSRKYE